MIRPQRARESRGCPPCGSHPCQVDTAERADPADSWEQHERLLTAAEVARILGVRPKRVYELPIPSIRLSERTLRWCRSDVMAWIADRKIA
jgi:predicted DNA-binding transcriptional regulator AlpA